MSEKRERAIRELVRYFARTHPHKLHILTAQWEVHEDEDTCPYCGALVLVYMVRQVRADGRILAEAYHRIKCGVGCFEEDWDEPDESRAPLDEWDNDSP